MKKEQLERGIDLDREISALSLELKRLNQKEFLDAGGRCGSIAYQSIIDIEAELKEQAVIKINARLKALQKEFASL